MSWLFSLYNFYKYLVSTRKGNKWQKIVLLISDLSGVKMEIYKDYQKDYEDCQTEFWSLCKGLRKHAKLHKEFLDQHTSIIEDAELEIIIIDECFG